MIERKMRTNMNKQKKKRERKKTHRYNNGYSIKQIFRIIFHFWDGGGGKQQRFHPFQRIVISAPICISMISRLFHKPLLNSWIRVFIK